MKNNSSITTLSSWPMRARAATLAVLTLAMLAIGCGSGDGSGGQETPDAAPQSSNALGQVCSASAACPTDPPHTCVFLSVGSQTEGYCSPMCSTAAECLAGYTGPTTGGIECLVPNTPNTCSISCTGPADCPTGLDCVSTGGPMSFCTVAP